MIFFLCVQETLTGSVLPTVGLGAVASGPGRPLSGFEPLANQRLLPPTFPRVTEIRERGSALKYLQVGGRGGDSVLKIRLRFAAWYRIQQGKFKS